MTAGAVSIIGLVNPVVGTLLGVAFAARGVRPGPGARMALVLGGVLVGQRFGSAARRTSGAAGGTHPSLERQAA